VKQHKIKLDGVVLLDKPIGITSNSALQKVRKIFNAEKAGHTGSLDPLATGVLPICFGQATKFSQLLLDANKVYIAKAKLGLVTDTGDTDGKILQDEECPNSITKNTILSALENFRGNIKQVPSMFSALKHNGVPLYKLAREGIVIEREARSIHIYELELQDYKESGEITLLVHCSKGTYIRSLVEDIGKTLGCGACVTALRRVKTGEFDIKRTHTIDEIISLAANDNHNDILQEVSSLVQNQHDIHLSDEHASILLKGQKLFLPSLINKNNIDSLSFWHQSLGFLGIGTIADTSSGQVVSKRLMSISTSNI
jgi:tRNA pseudouridine55 synthase